MLFSCINNSILAEGRTSTQGYVYTMQFNTILEITAITGNERTHPHSPIQSEIPVWVSETTYLHRHSSEPRANWLRQSRAACSYSYAVDDNAALHTSDVSTVLPLSLTVLNQQIQVTFSFSHTIKKYPSRLKQHQKRSSGNLNPEFLPFGRPKFKSLS